MKLLITLISGLAFTAGCASKCCNFDGFVNTYDVIIARQTRDNITKTGNNLRTLGNFFQEDLQSSPGRLASKASVIYDGVSFSRSQKNLANLAKKLGKWIDDANENLVRDSHILARCLCICRN